MKNDKPFSAADIAMLHSCHPDLQKIFNTANKYVAVNIIEGVRTYDRQRYLVSIGRSKTLKSKHLARLITVNGVGVEYSFAIDAAMEPINWDDKEGFTNFAYFVIGIATMLYDMGEIDHLLRWGGDWNSNFKTKDHKFYDGPHFELCKPRGK